MDFHFKLIQWYGHILYIMAEPSFFCMSPQDSCSYAETLLLSNNPLPILNATSGLSAGHHGTWPILNLWHCLSAAILASAIIFSRHSYSLCSLSGRCLSWTWLNRCKILAKSSRTAWWGHMSCPCLANAQTGGGSVAVAWVIHSNHQCEPLAFPFYTSPTPLSHCSWWDHCLTNELDVLPPKFTVSTAVPPGW